jgi:hypothetical protein
MSGPLLRLDLHTDVQRSEVPFTHHRQPVTARTRTPLLAEGTPLLMHARASQGLKPGLIVGCAAAQLGAIYTGAKPREMDELIRLHETLGAGPVLFDADRYTGKNRDQVKPTLDPDWVTAQRALGVRHALTDSPFIADGDRTRLASILMQGARMPGAITALPLGKRWFTHDAAELAELLNRFSTPVALMAQDRGDPFETERAVAGLIHVLDNAKVQVLLLRCDTSAIGALAFGASHAAIGTSTTLRHIWPPAKKSGGFGKADIAAYVPSAMSYRSLPTIGFAMLHYADDQLPWRCSCDVCAGNTLDCLAHEDEAALHSLLSLSDLTRSVLDDASQAAQSWIERCRTARYINEEISAKLIKNWPVPGNLDAWVKATS